jgi:hypothetical protein
LIRRLAIFHGRSQREKMLSIAHFLIDEITKYFRAWQFCIYVFKLEIEPKKIGEVLSTWKSYLLGDNPSLSEVRFFYYEGTASIRFFQVPMVPVQLDSIGCSVSRTGSIQIFEEVLLRSRHFVGSNIFEFFNFAWFWSSDKKIRNDSHSDNRLCVEVARIST